MDVFAIFQNILLQFSSALPKIFGAIIIAIIGWFISRLLSKFALAFLKRFRVDELADRINQLDMVERYNLKVKLSVVLSRIIYYFLMLFTLVAATDVLNMPVVSNMIVDLISFVPKLISASIVFLVGIFLADFLKKMVLQTTTSLNIPSGKIISNAIFYFIMINVAMSALTQAEVSTDFITTNISIILAGVVAAFALAYAYASRGILTNMLTAMYQKNRFVVGMEITIDGRRGIIASIDNNAFVLQLADSKLVIPLSKLGDSMVEIHE
jgi:hypothetical protein